MISQRHHLIYLKPGADFFLVSVHEDKKIMEKQVSIWVERGLPCIYAKQLPHERLTNLGLSLWYANKKHRVNLRIEPSAIQKQEPPPQLSDLHDFFLRYYGVDDLRRIIEVHQISDIAIYGSFLFQYLSGYNFVTKSSDLDVLINYHGYSLAHLRGFMEALAQKFKRSIDGEIRFQGIGDISIKELLNISTPKILCKSKDNVSLLLKKELYEYYPLL